MVVLNGVRVGGDFFSPRDICQCLEPFLVVIMGEEGVVTGIWWVGVRDMLIMLQCTGHPSITTNHQAQECL